MVILQRTTENTLYNKFTGIKAFIYAESAIYGETARMLLFVVVGFFLTPHGEMFLAYRRPRHEWQGDEFAHGFSESLLSAKSPKMAEIKKEMMKSWKYWLTWLNYIY